MSDRSPPTPSSHALGVALALLGLAAAGAALSIGGWGEGNWGPRTVPLLAAATLVAAGLATARAPSIARPPLAVEGEPVPPRGGAADEATVAWLLALAVGYVLLIDRVGYLVATALVAPAAFWLFGARRPLVLLAASTLVPLALHVVFFRLLGVFPPLGAWFDALDHVPL